MLITQADGTYLGGPLDVVCILLNVKTGIYHPAFFEESPLPGPIKAAEETTLVRLKSKMHHTEGYKTLEEALTGLGELRANIKVDDRNSCEEPIEWDGEIGIVWVFSNWLSSPNGTFQSVLNGSSG
jgi:hypothetical protein